MLRIRTKTGTKRVKLDTSDTIEILVEKVKLACSIQDGTLFEILRPSGEKLSILPRNTSLSKLHFQPGELLHLVESGSATTGIVQGKDRLDKVDRELMKAPLNEADEDINIKFRSFHSHIRHLQFHQADQRFDLLEEITTKLDTSGNESYPKALTSKCLPPPMTLQRQNYRHVDYVQFEDAEILNNFLNAWRSTGQQRAGFLLGTYQAYPSVPLGIQAVVTAIYEPPQENSQDGVQLLLPDPNSSLVDELCNQLGMQRVGWVFTDLEPFGKSGKVKYSRFVSEKSHTTVLNCTEVLHAAKFQCDFPNAVPKQWYKGGYHGSKFVTVVLSGNEDNQIVPTAFQASTQAMALVRDDILRPTSIPDLVAVTPNTDERYIPDIFFVEADEYNNKIKRRANPTFPVQYLHVDLEAGAAVDKEDVTFATHLGHFPVENRQSLGEVQSLESLKSYLQQEKPLSEKLRDFHLLFYMATDLPVSELQALVPQLCNAIAEKEFPQLNALEHNEHWGTLKMLLDSL